MDKSRVLDIPTKLDTFATFHKVTNILENMASAKPDCFYGSLSAEDVQAVISKALGPNVKVVDYRIKPFADVRVGFLSANLLLEVTVQRDTTISSETHSFFVKCIPHNSEKEEKLLNDLQVFKREGTFFRDLEPEMLKNFKGEHWSAECYLVKDDVLVFENLQIKNFRMSNLILDEATVKAAASTLARFHAASVILEKRLKKSFQEMYPDLFEGSIFNRGNFYRNWFRAGIDVIIDVGETLNLDTSKVRDYLMKIFEILKPSNTRRNILCHTDLWANNIMVNDDDDSPKCILIDYQTVRCVPPAADLAHLIFLTMPRKARDALEKSIVQQYHEVFKETVMRNEPDMEVRNLQELMEEYEEYKHYGLIYAAFQQPQMFMDEAFRSELSKDSVAFEKFFFEDRTGLVKELMMKNPDYREKITELVKEVVEYANRA
ncbi:uncharacterized protein LOC100115107 [Nasonia vitripennis]|uniref:CHK kinase-like domain-containing protein n=1 Tax=Nasonia vitripennis TaxID=7425 RepID=A0A7M7QEG0_NASVI|nr:uncharacterized protein LOC100115107 [Nasonia vitripennis]